jgi:hypothetical protein
MVPDGGTTGPPFNREAAPAAPSSSSSPSGTPLRKKSWLARQAPDPIEKVIGWQQQTTTTGGEQAIGWKQPPMAGGGGEPGRGFPALRCGGKAVASNLFRGRTPSYEALRGAVTDLYRLDDFSLETLGAGFFSDVYKVLFLNKFFRWNLWVCIVNFSVSRPDPQQKLAVSWIRIGRIRVFLDLPEPGPSVIKKNVKKNVLFYWFVTFL